ncbi:MAG: CoA-transferase subunit beta [Actinomycetota bacterium]
MTGDSYTLDELLCTTMARQIEDGDVLLEGIGAFLPTAAYELARQTHAPNAVSWSPIGGVFRSDSVQLGLGEYERETLRVAHGRATYGEIALWFLPAYLPAERPRWKEFMRPAQVDPFGNTNNVVIGPYDSPTVRLPGGVGLPDGCALERGLIMYVPRHDRRTLVGQVDFISGVGCLLPDGNSEGVASKPEVITTDLGVFEFEEGGGLRARSLHPGVGTALVRERTGFDITVPDDVTSTPLPTPEELRLLREVIDPRGLRRLELLAGRERLRLIREIIEEEPAPSSERAGRVST